MDKNDLLIIKAVKDEAEGKTLSELLSAAAASTEENKLSSCFSACFKATEQALGITPFDEQLLAALALVRGKIVQMQTGEGKTLSAVFAAYYRVMSGESVHIFTFNDYLAKRDYDWMKPVYDLLGIKIAYIKESTPFDERKIAYKAQVLYASAKECCFDFLRDFVAQSEDEIVVRECGCAIVDEADSILIDEARIPLVVAGDISSEKAEDMLEINDFTGTLQTNCYEISLESKSVFLTERGARKAEEHFGIENLYDDENSDLLIKINACLKAWFMLERDKDYIIRDGKILLVDVFTGRIAKNRHYPGVLQTAVEVMNKLEISTRGTIMGMIPLQFFIRKYPRLAGMTGTAMSSEEEFSELYDLQLEEVLPHLPSRRLDHDLQIYYDARSKWLAVRDCVVEAHKKRQPVLVGTHSIEESEALAKMLEESGIADAAVLNAKNDETEAEVIKNAGSLGRITVSTNMAGRGVDIKLGGADEKSREEVVEAGGLLVISTYLAESARINNQLLGRAGRQGDIGESRRFVSLDEPIMTKYNIKSLVPEKHYPKPTDGEIDDKVLLREVSRIQRISEGDTLEERKRLLKFTMIGEKHRDAIFKTRKRFLQGEKPKMWQESAPELYERIVSLYGAEKAAELERKTVIAKINMFWADYIEYTDGLREGIHLAAIGGKSPSEEFNISVEEYYGGMEAALYESMAESLESLAENGIGGYEINVPGEIRTYLIEDNGDELNKAPYMGNMTEEETERLMNESILGDEDGFDVRTEAAAEEKPAEKKKGGFFGLFKKK